MKLALAITTPEVSVTPPVALLSGSFGERLDKAQRLGYAGVELMVARPGELDAGELRARLRSCGLEAAAIASGPIFLQDRIALLAGSAAERQQAVARLDEMIDLGSALEAQVVTIGSFRGRMARQQLPAQALQTQAGSSGALPALVETLLAAAEKAARAGVSLALEPLNRYETDLVRSSSEGLEFLETASHPGLGLLLDTFHMNIEEADIPAALYRVHAAGKLFHIHLGDSNRLPPGQGHFNFGSLVRTLQALGYRGYLSAELFPQPDPDTAARLTIEYMRQYM